MNARSVLLLVLLLACWGGYAVHVLRWKVTVHEASTIPVIATETVRSIPVVADTSGKQRSATDTVPSAPPSTVSLQKPAPVTEPALDNAAGKGAPLVCELTGVSFIRPPFNKDVLHFTTVDGGRRYSVTGTLNGMSVSGWLKASGRSLTVLPREGANILSGSVAIEPECDHLTGDFTVRSSRSGGVLSVPIDLYDKAKGR